MDADRVLRDDDGFPIVGAATGYLAGTRLARLLPEPPKKQAKLTLRSKMTDRRERRTGKRPAR